MSDLKNICNPIDILERLVNKYETDMAQDDIEEFRGFIADARNDETDKHYDAAAKYLGMLGQEQGVNPDEVNLIGKDGNELFDLLA